MNGAPLLEVRDLAVRFTSADADVHAVQGVDLALEAGRVLVLLGESGSGKSVTLKALMRLHPLARTRYDGRIAFDGHDIAMLPEGQLRALRGRAVAMVFQDATLAFDPVFTIGSQIAETVRRHLGLGRRAARERALHWLEKVQIPSAARRLDAYPHELSGGMRQRAMIALALCCEPKLLLADEPTTALDATVQMQILLLLRELQRELGMAMIFVTHDVGVAAEIADDVAVMYAGRLVETGPADTVLVHPAHPYTRGLLGATVKGRRDDGALTTIPGAPPELLALSTACSFAPRCAHAIAACRDGVPNLVNLPDGQRARCVLAGELDEPLRRAAR